MKTYAKRVLFGLGCVGMLAGVSFGIASSKETAPILVETKTLRAEDTSADTNADDTSTSKVLDYTDDNGNGIPDVAEAYLEKYIEEANADDIMTTILKVASSFCTAVIGILMIWNKLRTLKNEVSETATQATESVNTYKEKTNQVADSVKSLTADTTALKEMIDKATASEDTQTKAIEELKESNEALNKGYSSINSMLSAILANQALLANTEANKKTGVNEQIQANVKGAIEYGNQNTEETKSEGN